jgi:CheY-like chemotaxis protein
MPAQPVLNWQSGRLGAMARVLVVEDETAIRSLLVDILRSEGYSVTEAVNGNEALVEVVRQRPDAIVLDLMMPVMDGRAFVYACHTLFPQQPIPVLLTSASPKLWQAGEQLRRFGVRGVVSKPFDLTLLIDAVAELLDPAYGLAAAG